MNEDDRKERMRQLDEVREQTMDALASAVQGAQRLWDLAEEKGFEVPKETGELLFDLVTNQLWVTARLMKHVQEQAERLRIPGRGRPALLDLDVARGERARIRVPVRNAGGADAEVAVRVELASAGDGAAVPVAAEDYEVELGRRRLRPGEQTVAVVALRTDRPAFGAGALSIFAGAVVVELRWPDRESRGSTQQPFELRVRTP